MPLCVLATAANKSVCRSVCNPLVKTGTEIENT